MQRRRGAVFDAFKCCEQTNTLLARCWLTPISHEPAEPSENSGRMKISVFFQVLAIILRGRDKAWHGGCFIGHRAQAQTSIQPTSFTTLGELKC